MFLRGHASLVCLPWQVCTLAALRLFFPPSSPLTLLPPWQRSAAPVTTPTCTQLPLHPLPHAGSSSRNRPPPLAEVRCPYLEEQVARLVCVRRLLLAVEAGELMCHFVCPRETLQRKNLRSLAPQRGGNASSWDSNRATAVCSHTAVHSRYTLHHAQVWCWARRCWCKRGACVPIT